MLIALLVIGIIILTLVSFVLVCYVLNPFNLSQFNQGPSKYRHFHQSSRQSSGTNSSLNDDSTKYCSDDSAVVCNGSPASLRPKDDGEAKVDGKDVVDGAEKQVTATAAVHHQNGDAVRDRVDDEVQYVELMAHDAPTPPAGVTQV